MRVLVTGAGFLGAHIAERFRARGDEVRLLTLSLPEDMRGWAEGLEGVVLGDVTDPATVAGACEGCDAVVHTAALNAAASDADDRAAVLVNGYGTANVVERAAESGARSLVYLSTFHVYGPPRGESIDEMTPCFPANAYAATHLLGESYVQRAVAKGRLGGTVLRLANGYGAPLFSSADCWMLAANDFARSAVRGGRIVLGTPGVQQRDFVPVTDIARAVEHFIDKPAPAELPVVCIGSGESVSIRALAENVADACERITGNRMPVDVPDALPTAPPAPFTYDVSRAAALGFRPAATMADTLDDLVRFVVEHPEL